jgi:hypothetical protein
MTLSFLSRISITAFALCFFGCVPWRVDIQPDFWKDTRRRIGVAVMPAPELHVYPLPDEVDSRFRGTIFAGSARRAYVLRTATLEAHLRRIDVSRFGEVADRYVEEFKARGFDARKLAGPPRMEHLPVFEGSEPGEFAEKDLRSLASKEDIDVLILVSLERCGTRVLDYWGMAALCKSKGEMIDLKTNRVEWRAEQEEEAGLVPIQGEWDQPPDFPSVTRSLGNAVTQAEEHMVMDLFLGNAATKKLPGGSALEKRRLLREKSGAATGSSP